MELIKALHVHLNIFYVIFLINLEILDSDFSNCTSSRQKNVLIMA